jgi:predicted double-glycine peptidase
VEGTRGASPEPPFRTTLVELRRTLAVALVLCAGPARAATQSVDVGPTRLSGRVASFRELRDRGVVRQKHDYSCGAAAFSTLLLHGFADPVSEEDLLADVFSGTTEAQERLIRNKGLSLLDMQRIARGRGYKAQGFRIGSSDLARLRRPVLVFIQPLGYQHFAVLKGIRGGRAFLADPSQGNWTLPLSRFLAMWLDDATGKGVIFVVERPDGRWPPHGPLFLDEQGPRAVPLGARALLETARPGNDPLPRR